MLRPASRAVAAVVLMLTLAAGAAVQPAWSDDRFTVKRSSIAPGVSLYRIRDSVGPKQIRMVALRPGGVDASIDVALAGPAFPSYAKPSDIGKRRGALVAINGDFAGSGRPVHLFARNGRLKTLGIQRGASFGVSLDESLVKLDRPAPEVTVRIRRSADRDLRGLRWTATWNSGAPRRGELAVFTPVGGTVERPPANACSVRLERRPPLAWTSDGASITQLARVTRNGVCRERRVAPPTAREIVLSTRWRTALGKSIERLAASDEVRVTWTTGPGWLGMTETIGGAPLLVRPDSGGKPVNLAPEPSPECGYFCSRNPRTGVGIRADGTVLLMVVDGRRPHWSVGMTLVQFGREFIRRGAVWAVNLDGGGGAVMWVKGRGIVNKPSGSSGERAAVSAVLVLPGPDASEPKALRTSSAGSAEPTLVLSPAVASLAPLGADDPDAWREAMLDPGSTGGLLDAIAGGTIGSPDDLTPGLLRILARYREALGPSS